MLALASGLAQAPASLKALGDMDDPAPASEGFPELMRDDRARPALLRSAPSSLLADDTEELTPLSCGQKADVYRGDRVLLQNFGDACTRDLDIGKSVAVDMICDFLYVPCEYDAVVDFNYFGGRSGADRLCLWDRVYFDQDFRFRPVERGYVMEVEAMEGTYFSCTMVGISGEERPGDGNDNDNDNADDPIQSEDCGKTAASTKIIGGSPANPGDYPWQVALILGGAFCGGSVVNEKWIMTAAHCAEVKDPNSIVAYFGCTNIGSDPDCQFSRRVSKVEIHPGWKYDDDGIFNDIALLELESSIPLGEQVASTKSRAKLTRFC